MKKVEIDLPPSYLFSGRRFYKRSEIEHLKNCLVAKATGRDEPDYRAPQIEQFVPAPQVAEEFGLSRRTLARRIAAQEKSQAA